MIALGCDSGGFELMQHIKSYLIQKNLAYKDFGTYDDSPADYPIFAQKVTRAILSGECERGITICGTGIGISIAANRFKGIRCALCHDTFSAKATREHNDSNILAMGGRVIGSGLACEIVDVWLNTNFSNEERHKRRIDLIENFR